MRFGQHTTDSIRLLVDQLSVGLKKQAAHKQSSMGPWYLTSNILSYIKMLYSVHFLSIIIGAKGLIYMCTKTK